jgi:hypothetical protein
MIRFHPDLFLNCPLDELPGDCVAILPPGDLRQRYRLGDFYEIPAGDDVVLARCIGSSTDNRLAYFAVVLRIEQ